MAHYITVGRGVAVESGVSIGARVLEVAALGDVVSQAGSNSSGTRAVKSNRIAWARKNSDFLPANTRLRPANFGFVFLHLPPAAGRQNFASLLPRPISNWLCLRSCDKRSDRAA